MEVFADEANLPAVISCIMGKDRTGFIVILLLLLIGLSREEIVRDHLITNMNLMSQIREKNKKAVDVWWPRFRSEGRCKFLSA